MTARCFGNFEVFVNGKILEFEKAKTKEMLAYLHVQENRIEAAFISMEDRFGHGFFW